MSHVKGFVSLFHCHSSGPSLFLSEHVTAYAAHTCAHQVNFTELKLVLAIFAVFLMVHACYHSQQALFAVSPDQSQQEHLSLVLRCR